MNLFTRLFFTGSALTLSVISCVQHDIPIKYECASAEIVSYQSRVRPIVLQNCAISGCHDGGFDANLDWRDFNKFQSHATEVRRRITLPATDPDHMPRVGSLTTDEISTIVCWIDQGAQNN